LEERVVGRVEGRQERGPEGEWSMATAGKKGKTEKWGAARIKEKKHEKDLMII